MIIESYKQGSISTLINANILIRRITVQKIHDTDKYRINNDIRTVLIKGVILKTANKSSLDMKKITYELWTMLN